jgi:hypothetical protein
MDWLRVVVNNIQLYFQNHEHAIKTPADHFNLLRGLASILGVAEGEVGAMRQLLLWPPSEPPPTAASSSFLLLKRLRVAQLVEEALKAMRGPRVS